MLSMDNKGTFSSSWFCSEAELSYIGFTSLLLPLQQEIWLPEPKSFPKGFWYFHPGRSGVQNGCRAWGCSRVHGAVSDQLNQQLGGMCLALWGATLGEG